MPLKLTHTCAKLVEAVADRDLSKIAERTVRSQQRRFISGRRMFDYVVKFEAGTVEHSQAVEPCTRRPSTLRQGFPSMSHERIVYVLRQSVLPARSD